MKRSRPTLGPLVLTGLVSLYLAVACWFAGRAVPESLASAVRGGAHAHPQPTGPVGAALAGLSAWSFGPWLRWLLPLLPWLWLPLSDAKGRRGYLTRVAWGAVTVVAVLGLSAHPALRRLGAAPGNGGALGSALHGGVGALLGSLGSFLLLACASAWLLLRYVPGGPPTVHVDPELPARGAGVLRSLGGWLGRGAWQGTRRTGQAAALASGHAAQAVRDLRERARSRRAAAEATAPQAGSPFGAPSTAGESAARWAELPLDAGRAAAAATAGATAAERTGPQRDSPAQLRALLDRAMALGERTAPAQSSAGALEAALEPAAPHAPEAPAAERAADPFALPAAETRVAFDDEAHDALQAELPLDLAEQPDAGEAPALAAAAGGGTQEFRLSRDPAELLRREEIAAEAARARRRGRVKLPPLTLLDDVVKEERGFSREALQMNARLLLETLANYGIEGQINEIRPGPVVTTFEFEPAAGVKVSQITSRQDDLALAMRAVRIRIEAPIPGKAAVGIEIPNPYPQMVTLKQVMGSLLADAKAKPLAIALGKDVEGNPFHADLADMPHLLVAGATGSGKSVCLNALICNLLLRNSPERVRLLMIDPKMLELSVYNGIPHLLHPVITEAKEALKALRWMVEHMSVRYSKLAKHGVRNIQDYNEKVRQGQVHDHEGRRIDEEMPYVVVIVDELADLMMLLGQDLETPIARLAQMARAVGIHLVLATQRPSVNVITGVIKANFPSRVAFRVISKIDSRTILDAMGAEQLLGKGDMLFLMAGWAQPQRIHGAYLALAECDRIAGHWRQQCEEPARLDLEEASTGTGALDLGEDELLDEARRIVVLAQSGSVSLLQRRLRVGYTRAARLMDMLEEQGVVGPFDGSKAREVLVGREELETEP